VYFMTKKKLEQVFEKLPPQNLEAEDALLGSLLIDKEAVIKIADTIEPQDFYRETNQMIYQAMLDVWEKRDPIDILSVGNRLDEKKQLKIIGGKSHLASLANSVPSSSHADSYAQIIKKKSTLRKLINSSTETIQMAYQEEQDAIEILDKAEQKLFSISQKYVRQKFVSLKDTLSEAFERIDELHKGEKAMRGVPTGFADLDNSLAGLQPSELIILAARPSIGKCVTGDTEIVSSNPGSISTIKEVVESKKKNLLTLDDKFKFIKTQASDFIDNGQKPVFQTKTSLGKQIQTTITHPFLTINGWKPLSELKIGDRVATARKISIFGKTSLSDHQIKALAYFITEGGLTNKSPIFTNSNKRIAREFIQCMQKFSNIKVKKIRKEKNGKVFDYRVSGIKQNISRQMKMLAGKVKKIVKKSGFTQMELAQKTGLSYATISAVLNGHWLPLKKNFIKILTELNLNDAIQEKLMKKYNQIRPKNSVTEWLQKLGLMGKLSIEKSIPEIVFTFNKKKLALFLNRLFSCDGCIWQNKKFKTYHISYSSSSKKLIKQVQHLLLRFGIISRVREKKIKYKGKIKLSYEIEIHNSENICTFIEEIGFYRKKEKVIKIKKDLLKIKKLWTQDTLPIEIWETILKIKGKRTWRSVYQGLDLPKEYNIHAFRRNPRRETVEKLGKILNSPLLKNLAKSDIYWDRITDIKYVGKRKVYDLTVPKTHNFIANDFIVHNSSLALDIARHAAVYHKTPVGIFSLEMSKDHVSDRIICAQANVSLWKLRTGRLSRKNDDGDFEKLGKSFGILAEAPIFVDDSAMATPIEIRTKARRLQVEHGLGLLIVDYLQLMEGGPGSKEGRVQEVSYISRCLKAIARELNIPVLAISQLNRAPEARTPAIPRLSDLRESGSLEQDADVVMFIYRKSMDMGIKNCPEHEKNIAEIHIAKHRHGPAGMMIPLYFDGDTASFKNLEKKMKDLEIGEDKTELPF